MKKPKREVLVLASEHDLDLEEVKARIPGFEGIILRADWWIGEGWAYLVDGKVKGFAL